MNPLNELEQRYPEADFWAYFSFLEACKGTEKGLDTHEHHICPRKQFPEYAKGFPENLITLKIDDHAWAHSLLGAAVPKMRRANAAWLLSVARSDHSIGGRAAALKNKEQGTGLYDPKVRALGGNNHTPEFLAAMGRIGGRKTADSGSLAIASASVRARPGHQAKAGKQGGLSLPREVHVRSGKEAARVHKENGTGFYSKDQQSRIAKKRLHTRWHVRRGIVNPECSFCKEAL